MDIQKHLEFLHQISKLKALDRAGWVRKQIPKPESVADHSFRVALMALIWSAEAGLDTCHCMKLALIHDLGESIIGDITPHDPISSDQKFEMEQAAVQSLSQCLGQEEVIRLWQEYAQQTTSEAKFVMQLDKLEMVIQAAEYSRQSPNIDLHEFWESTKDIWTFPFLQKIYQSTQIKK